MTTRSQISLALVCTLCALPASATAEPYWIAYEGNDFPENEGWTRVYGDGHWPPQDEPDRWIENGELVIDTLRDDQLWEYYERLLLDPADGEVFVAEWRFRSELLYGTRDNGVVIARQGVPGFAGFQVTANGVLVRVDDVTLPVDPSVYHEYQFQSADMVAYDLFIDGEHAYAGMFETDTFLQGFIAFGAGTQGASSVSHWDHFRFGVVPEPATGILILATGVNVIKRIRRREISR